MEITVRTPNAPDRSVSVETAAFTVGSDLSCDYVVMAPGIDRKHLSFAVEPQGVMVTNTGLTPVVMRTARGKVTTCETGETIPYQDLACLEIGETTIELSLGLDAATADSRDAMQRPGWLGRIGATAFRRPQPILIVASVLVGSLSWGAVSTGTLFAAPAGDARGLRDPIATDATLARVRIENRFRALAVADLSVIPSGDRYIVRGYTRSNEEKRELAIAAADLPDEIKLEIHSAEEVSASVRSVLDKMGVDTDVMGVSANEVTLGSLLDADTEAMVRRAIVSDVAGAGSVRFEAQDETRITKALKGKILAVWAGADPYAFGEDGEAIYPGDTIFNDVVLQSIESPTQLTVSDGTNTWKVDWNG